MEHRISSNTKIRFQILGYYQIIGGITGILFNIYGFFTQLPVFGPVIIIPFIFLLLYGFSIYCGRQCLKFEDNSLSISLYNQAFQILSFSLLGIIFSYVAGMYITINLNFSNSIQVSFNAGISNFKFYFNNNPDILIFGFNLIPLGIIFFINRVIYTGNNENELII